MNNTINWELKDIDAEDIEDVLVEVEKSFDIKFKMDEFTNIKTFGELCSIITNKVQGLESNDCTTQQAFYKLRKAIAEALLIDKFIIKPDSQLETLFTKKKRRRKIREVEKILGFQVKILEPKNWITKILFWVILISIIAFFVDLKIGFIGLCSSLLMMNVVYKLGQEFEIKTIKELVEKMTREKYRFSRRNSLTINRREVVKQIKELFKHQLDLEDSALKSDAPLY